MHRTSIAVAQLLHGLVLDTDSFLPNPICFLDSSLYRPRLFYPRSECFGANRPAADSAAADLILSHALARREARALFDELFRRLGPAAARRVAAIVKEESARLAQDDRRRTRSAA